MTTDLLAGWMVHAHVTLGSTNDEARRLAGVGADDILVTAVQQTAGRGRLGRVWSSPPGNLHASFLLQSGVAPSRAPEIGFVAALAVLDACDALSPRRARLKWPNDVLLDDAKLAGILTEMIGTALVIGIGLNVGFAPAPLPYATACLGPSVTVEQATAALAGAMRHRLAQWRTNGFGLIRADWMARGPALGSTLAVRTGTIRTAGCYAGLDTDGALLLDRPDGRRRIIAGEVDAQIVR